MEERLTQTIDDRRGQDYKLGLALSGGGARGLAHVGALKAIDEAGLRVDVIAGVSSGSIAAVLYAAGIKPDTILKIFSSAKFRDFAEITPGIDGMVKIDRFIDYFRRILGRYCRLEDLQIPTYVGVTNFEDGVAEEFHEGPIAPIVKASCSIPITIRPVLLNGKMYVDGGVMRNLPAWTIRDKCDRLIGINVSPLPPEKKEYKNLYSIGLRTYTLMAKSNQPQDLLLCDDVVSCDEITNHNVFSLKELQDVFDSGYRTMKEVLGKPWHPKHKKKS